MTTINGYKKLLHECLAALFILHPEKGCQDCEPPEFICGVHRLTLKVVDGLQGHGSGGYTRGCRCSKCRAARAKYQKELRASYIQKVSLPEEK